jgi:hypothetical protein
MAAKPKAKKQSKYASKVAAAAPAPKKKVVAKKRGR